VKLRPMASVRESTGQVSSAGVLHIITADHRTVCGVQVRVVFAGPDYASCRSCLKKAGYALPAAITNDEFNALARELGIDMHHWYASIQEECFDDDGMPIVHYPALEGGRSTYEILLAALARIV